jgi:hypothetical protein
VTVAMRERVLLEVAWATAGLLSAPLPRLPLDARSAAVSLVCRDALLRELRVVLRGVLGVGLAAPDPDRSAPGGSVVRSLHVALAELPLVGEQGLTLREALEPRGSAVVTGWQQVACAAVALEARLDGLVGLPAAEVLSLLADVAALLQVLLELDLDLGRRLPTGFRAERVRLVGPLRRKQAGVASAALLELFADATAVKSE